MSQYEGTRYCSNQEQGCAGNPMTKRNERGATVDECNRCGGMFLDRGELAMIIATVAGQPGFNPQRLQQRAQHGNHGGGHGYSGHHHSSSDNRHHRRSNEGFLDMLF